MCWVFGISKHEHLWKLTAKVRQLFLINKGNKNFLASAEEM